MLGDHAVGSEWLCLDLDDGIRVAPHEQDAAPDARCNG